MLWQSPAKINLHLRVGGVEPDGFHQLSSWMVTVGLFDKLSFEFDTSNPSDSNTPITIRCNDPKIPLDDSNLILKAGRAWAQARHDHESWDGEFDFLFWGLEEGQIKVLLEKNIPPGGGLGGGSSNAASTILFLENFAWQMKFKRLDDDVIKRFAAQLGSDVPFFFDAPSALSSGRGEKIVRVASPKPKAVMLFFPSFGISTAEAYRVLDELRPFPPKDALDPIDVEEWKMLSAAALLPRLRNDLELAAFHLQPRLAELRGMLERKLERPVRMSGSGSTLFTLYDTESEASDALRKNLGSDFGLAKVRVCSLGSARIEQII